MLVTREADYAIRCVLEVARAGHTNATRVAQAQGISATFLGKIVQSLAKAGILATRRGVGGGITLARPPERFTLLEVIEAVEGRLSIMECLRSPEGCCHVGDCPALPYLELAQARLRATLDVPFSQLLRPSPVDAREVAPIEGPSGNGRRSPRVRTPDPAAGGDG